jgi:hypothetical protein
LIYSNARAIRGASPFPAGMGEGHLWLRYSVVNVRERPLPFVGPGSTAGPGRPHAWAVGAGGSALTQNIGLMLRPMWRLRTSVIVAIRSREGSAAYASLSEPQYSPRARC